MHGNLLVSNLSSWSIVAAGEDRIDCQGFRGSDVLVFSRNLLPPVFLQCVFNEGGSFRRFHIASEVIVFRTRFGGGKRGADSEDVFFASLCART
jgi:hypothetical protein